MRRVQHRGHTSRRCRLAKHWKIKYGSEDAAEKAARAMTSDSKTGETYTAYPCPGCGHWHVGRPHEERKTG